MSNQTTHDDFPPIPSASTTVEKALANLAGAVDAVLTIFVEEHGDEFPPLEFVMLLVAMTQWRNSGFMVDEAGAISAMILSARETSRAKQEGGGT